MFLTLTKDIYDDNQPVVDYLKKLNLKTYLAHGYLVIVISLPCLTVVGVF